ncbi:MAG: hypothetical protein RL248_1379 [Pseudomonadota bacterium]
MHMIYWQVTSGGRLFFELSRLKKQLIEKKDIVKRDRLGVKLFFYRLGDECLKLSVLNIIQIRYVGTLLKTVNHYSDANYFGDAMLSTLQAEALSE